MDQGKNIQNFVEILTRTRISNSGKTEYCERVARLKSNPSKTITIEYTESPCDYPPSPIRRQVNEVFIDPCEWDDESKKKIVALFFNKTRKGKKALAEKMNQNKKEPYRETKHRQLI